MIGESKESEKDNEEARRAQRFAEEEFPERPGKDTILRIIAFPRARESDGPTHPEV
jgi:hypothetical protein